MKESVERKEENKRYPVGHSFRVLHYIEREAYTLSIQVCIYTCTYIHISTYIYSVCMSMGMLNGTTEYKVLM